MRLPGTGQIELALRERLEMAGCYPVRDRDDGAEEWYTPHLNRTFTMPGRIASSAEANAVLRRAGMEEAF